MKRAIAVSCLSAALFLAPRVASAQCTIASPMGAWGFNAQGFIATPVSLVDILSVTEPRGPSLSLTLSDPVGEAGVIVFDGSGHLSVTLTINNNGSISVLGPFTGTYSVNSNCTFAMVFHTNPGMSFSGTFVNGVQEFRVIDNEAQSTITGVGKLIAAVAGAPCTAATPSGSWGFNFQGYVGVTSSIVPTFAGVRKRVSVELESSATPYAAAGILTFDGVSQLTFTETYSSGGQSNQLGPETGSYFVNPDCSFTMIFRGGPVTLYSGVLVNGGTELLVVDTINGTVVTGSGRHE